KIFTCRPTSPAEELGCSRQIVKRIAGQAFRRPVTDRELERLMSFYDEGRKERDFETGVGAALEAILASPQFVFRFERVPAAKSAAVTAASPRTRPAADGTRLGD